MDKAFLSAGIVALIAAVVGGGLKGYGFEIPVLASKWRQFALGALGCVLVISGLAIHGTETDTPNSPEVRLSAASIDLTQSTWTLRHAVDDSGTSWSHSRLQFTSQKHFADGDSIKGYLEWYVQDTLKKGVEQFEGVFNPGNGVLIFHGTQIDSGSGRYWRDLALGSYSAHISADGLSLTDGTWGDVAKHEPGVLGKWDATR